MAEPLGPKAEAARDRGMIAIAGALLAIAAIGGAVLGRASRRVFRRDGSDTHRDGSCGGGHRRPVVRRRGGGASGGASTCSPEPESCDGWFRGDVAITWSFDPGWTSISCDGTPVTSDTTGTSRTCSVTYSSGTVSTTITIKRDATPPTVSAAAGRAADQNGWYNRPVQVSFAGQDATSGIASCSSPTYGGPDGGSVSVSGGCTDKAGTAGLRHCRFDTTRQGPP